jgi:Protein of unknown function (DUF3426)
VLQLGASAVADPAPQITVHASLRNRAKQRQPAPLLRVVLQDRFGNPIATQEIAPSQYLRAAAPAWLGAEAQIDAVLTLPDPGQRAVGFEIDACLRAAGGQLRCAGDSAPR